MRKGRNVAFLLLVAAWFVMNPGPLRATDLGCDGEDGVGSTPPSGPYYCSGSEGCCETAWEVNRFDTLEPFCEPYGGVDWSASYWTAGVSAPDYCSGFVIECRCIPLPAPKSVGLEALLFGWAK